jgi:predicted CoA-binding protein
MYKDLFCRMEIPPYRTLIVGASAKPDRYAYMAAVKLQQHGYPIVQIALREGEAAGQPILAGQPELHDIHTVTLYVGPQHQPAYYDYLLLLRPKRVIFNPGTENAALEALLTEAGIEWLHACTLTMLAIGQYE